MKGIESLFLKMGRKLALAKKIVDFSSFNGCSRIRIERTDPSGLKEIIEQGIGSL